MVNLSETARMLGTAVGVLAVAVGGFMVTANAFDWLRGQIRRPWYRLLRRIGFDESADAVSKAPPAAALEEAWRLHARAHPYTGRPARRFRVATAAVDSVVGQTLVSAGRWEDALAHLLPAITTFRGVRGTEEILAGALLLAANAHDRLGDPDSVRC